MECGSSEGERRPFRILLGCTGSVASIKIPILVDQLQKKFEDLKYPVSISVVPTANAIRFFPTQSVINSGGKVYTDDDEWKAWSSRVSSDVDRVLHITLREHADIVVVAPVDANTLAKLANGLCDNLLTCILRAWPPNKPVIVAPAMNTQMYFHPFTSVHLKTLKEFLGYEIMDVVEKTLVCGERGTPLHSWLNA